MQWSLTQIGAFGSDEIRSVIVFGRPRTDLRMHSVLLFQTEHYLRVFTGRRFHVAVQSTEQRLVEEISLAHLVIE